MQKYGLTNECMFDIITSEQMFGTLVPYDINCTQKGVNAMTKDMNLNNMMIVRKKSNKRRGFLFRYFTNKAILVFCIAFLLILSLFFVTHTLAADTSSDRVKTIESVRISEGDTLWSIAKEYYTVDCGNISDYISEIKRSIGLKSDVMHSGSYLIIPHYITLGK